MSRKIPKGTTHRFVKEDHTALSRSLYGSYMYRKALYLSKIKEIDRKIEILQARKSAFKSTIEVLESQRKKELLNKPWKKVDKNGKQK